MCIYQINEFDTRYLHISSSEISVFKNGANTGDKINKFYNEISTFTIGLADINFMHD